MSEIKELRREVSIQRSLVMTVLLCFIGYLLATSMMNRYFSDRKWKQTRELAFDMLCNPAYNYHFYITDCISHNQFVNNSQNIQGCYDMYYEIKEKCNLLADELNRPEIQWLDGEK